MKEHVGKRASTDGAREVPATPAAPGRRSLVETTYAVQQRAQAAPAQDPAAVHAAAAQGVATASSPLPHGPTLQRLFGRHDISDVQAHTSPEAAASARAMGADAYATGNHVVLGDRSDLFTVAHEAAHVVQQRAGVQLKGGVGAVGDVYERHADEVASAVVAGQSAESLLDRHAGQHTSAGGGHAIQRITSEELKTRGQRIEELASTAPEAGINLWVAHNTELPAEIHLLGTEHSQRLSQMGSDQTAREYLITYLQSEPFTRIFSETTLEPRDVTVMPNLLQALDNKRAAVSGEKALPESASRAQRLRAQNKVTTADTRLGGVDSVALDDAYVHVARADAGGNRKASNPPIGTLEDAESRKLAADANRRDLHITDDDPESRFQTDRRPSEVTESNDVVPRGDQKQLFRDVADELKSGRDIAHAEERNRQWIARLSSPANLAPNDKQLWVVGAAHLPGLILRLQDLGWKVSHRGPVRAEAATRGETDEKAAS